MNDICDSVVGPRSADVVDPRDRSQMIVAYLKGEMSEEEQAGFEVRMTEDETLQEEIEKARGVLDSLTASSEPPIIELVKKMIVTAIERQASDLHIIPDGKTVRILYRIDGALTEIAEQDRLPTHLLQPIVDRWKVMCEMNLAEKRLTQDGRLPIHFQSKEFELRVSVIPALHGECITTRIVPTNHILMGLDQRGYAAESVAALRRLCRLRRGLVITGGWAGSGRTTLMYSLLQEMQSTAIPRRKILTIEEPVEMNLSNDLCPVTQVSVNTRIGMTFAAGLHSALRQDPDIVYCGEMGNAETAELCVKAVTMGILLFGTLSVTSALSILPRLRNMGIPNYQIADSLAGLIGVRLVRRIDSRQTEEYRPGAEEIQRAGLAEYQGSFVRGVPTPENGQTGFAGRVPLIEVVEMTPRLRHLIAEGADLPALAKAAYPHGGTLRDAARAKVKAGLTTVEEANWALFDYDA